MITNAFMVYMVFVATHHSILPVADAIVTNYVSWDDAKPLDVDWRPPKSPTATDDVQPTLVSTTGLVSTPTASAGFESPLYLFTQPRGSRYTFLDLWQNDIVYSASLEQNQSTTIGRRQIGDDVDPLQSQNFRRFSSRPVKSTYDGEALYAHSNRYTNSIAARSSSSGPVGLSPEKPLFRSLLPQKYEWKNLRLVREFSLNTSRFFKRSSTRTPRAGKPITRTNTGGIYKAGFEYLPIDIAWFSNLTVPQEVLNVFDPELAALYYSDRVCFFFHPRFHSIPFEVIAAAYNEPIIDEVQTDAIKQSVDAMISSILEYKNIHYNSSYLCGPSAGSPSFEIVTTYAALAAEPDEPTSCNAALATVCSADLQATCLVRNAACVTYCATNAPPTVKLPCHTTSLDELAVTVTSTFTTTITAAPLSCPTISCKGSYTTNAARPVSTLEPPNSSQPLKMWDYSLEATILVFMVFNLIF